MSEQDWLARRFEENRSHLQAVAYRMLGSMSDADDTLQEAWLRLSRSDAGRVDNLSGWLTTVVGRICLDILRARRSRREEYGGTWLPEPVVTLEDATDPEHEAVMADSVGLALLVVLETLTPAERLAFVLHDSHRSRRVHDRRRPDRGPRPRARPREAAGALGRVTKEAPGAQRPGANGGAT